MRLDDTQLGRPETIYKDTQANIEALASPVEGMIAYATDTNQLGSYDGAAWTWYSAVPTGQYRQFVYEVSGGDFSFVIDEEGNPIMALEDLE